MLTLTQQSTLMVENQNASLKHEYIMQNLVLTLTQHLTLIIESLNTPL